MEANFLLSSFVGQNQEVAKKTVAIIGATENAGAAIAKNLAGGNYRLLLFAHDHDKASSLVNEITEMIPTAEIECLNCLVDASWEADIIISAVPPGMEAEIAQKIKGVATQKIVMVIAGYGDSNSDKRIVEHSAAEELQKLLPYSKVVKAFSSARAADFARAVTAGRSIDSFIAGDDREAVQMVTEIISNAGFHPVNAGELATSRALEHIS